MAQSQQLINTLKRLLKTEGKTYADVARHLGLSEASIKRQFSRQSFSLRTLQAICELLQLELSELALMAEAEQPRLRQLSEQQEIELVSNPLRVLVAVCVLNHWSVERIIATYRISKAECIQHLLQLDQIGMIRLLPENRVRLKIDRDFTWLPGGPIHRFFRSRVQADFLNADFQQSGELLRFQQAMLSPADNLRLQQKIHRLLQEFSELHAEGLNSPDASRDGTVLLVALRPWEPDSFAALRREPNERPIEAEG